MRKLVFLLLYFAASVSAFQIGISPPEINATLKVGEAICKNISISVSSDADLNVRDVWAQEGEINRELTKHTLTSSFLGIVIVYDSKISVSKSKNVSVCLFGKNPGIYHGALIYSGKNAGVGVWILLNVTGSAKNNFLTGSAIDNLKNHGMRGFILAEMFIILILLIALYVYLRKWRK